jgi:hypothetical protein
MQAAIILASLLVLGRACHLIMGWAVQGILAYFVYL